MALSPAIADGDGTTRINIQQSSSDLPWPDTTTFYLGGLRRNEVLEIPLFHLLTCGRAEHTFVTKCELNLPPQTLAF